MANSKAPKAPQYRLEHRLTGAVILVALAVLVIPLLLKEPGLEANAKNTSQANSAEKTFKLKIEPLNLSDVINNNIVATPESEDDLENSPDKNPKWGKVSGNAETGSGKNTGKNKPALVMTVDKKPEERQEKTRQKGLRSSEVGEVAKDNSQDTAKKNIAGVADGNVERRKDKATASGEWVVRAGTFSKPANAERFRNELLNSGFSPNLTKVEIGLGKATQVWLGPYKEKAKAERVSARLKDLIGEKGYVTKHTS